jgi:hypothetical protein
VTARILLAEAHRTIRDQQRSREFIELAKNHLYRALGTCENDSERGVVRQQLGLAYLALGFGDDARHWLYESLRASESAVSDLIQRAQQDTLHARVRYIDGRNGQKPPLFSVRVWAVWGRNFTNIIFLIILLARLIVQGVRTIANPSTKNSVADLRDFIQFYNGNITIASSIGVPGHRQMLVLRKEMIPFSDPAFMLRLVSASNSLKVVDARLDSDPDMRMLKSPGHFFFALFKGVMQDEWKKE